MEFIAMIQFGILILQLWTLSLLMNVKLPITTQQPTHISQPYTKPPFRLLAQSSPATIEKGKVLSFRRPLKPRKRT
jgi:hypothetical protein